MQHHTGHLAFGPREPEWIRLVRDEYWAAGARLEQLVGRLCRTDAGMAFYYRCKRIGHR